MTYIEKVNKAKDLIAESLAKYPKIAVGCSFGKDSMVLLHLAHSVKPDIPVFSILADTEFDETIDFKNKVVTAWKLNYKEFIFNQENGIKANLALCCGKPKVDATKLAVKEVDAWISGVRKTEGITRSDFKYIEAANGLVKINPILEFTELDIWRYLALNKIPVNPKYNEGFRSLGCRYCSYPEADESETERAGRWKGTGKACGECGIHSQPLR